MRMKVSTRGSGRIPVRMGARMGARMGTGAAVAAAVVVALGAAAGCGGVPDAGESPGDMAARPLVCNGSARNCGRRFDQVTFAATHNAYSYAAGGDVRYLFPSQDRPIPDQLAAGIRGLGIRPGPYFGDDPKEQARVYTTHNWDLMGALGQEPLVDVLRQVKTFLDENPSETVSLFAESAASPAAVAATFAEAGLADRVYTHDAARGFPTLGELAQQDRRVLLFYVQSVKVPGDGGAPPAWFLPMWDFIVDTDYDVTDASQFTCDFYRGSTKSPLYFINQFIYKAAGSQVKYPDKDLAQIANDPAAIVARAEACRKQTGRLPSYVYVDWYGQGDPVGAAKALNELR